MWQPGPGRRWLGIISSFALFVGLAALARAQETAPAASPDTTKATGQADSSNQPIARPPDVHLPDMGTPGEDSSTPRLADARIFPPADAFEMGKADYPGFTRELLRAQWRGGDPIDLWVIKPAGIKNPPVILYLYSYPTDTDLFANLEAEEQMTKDGFAAVGFVSALTGQRYHDIPQKKWFVSELPTTLSWTAHDVQMVLNYLATRGDLDMTRVGMYGVGSGASIAIMAAAVDARIKALNLIDPWGDWPDWLAKSPFVPENERADYVKPEFLAKLENLDPVKWLPALRAQKVHLQFIENNKTTPGIARERLEAAAPRNAKIEKYNTRKELVAKAGGTIGGQTAWMRQQLQSSVRASR